MKTPYHVYADDGFESAHRSPREAYARARRGSRLRPGIVFAVAQTGPSGYTGPHNGTILATYLRGDKRSDLDI